MSTAPSRRWPSFRIARPCYDWHPLEIVTMNSARRFKRGRNGDAMSALVRTTLCIVGAVMLIRMSARADVAQPETAQVVKAANAFLATLDAKQRESVSFAFDDEKQR